MATTRCSRAPSICRSPGPDAPAALHEAFGELRETVRPLAGEDDLETPTETFRACLHGLLTLLRDGRLRRDEHDRRLAILIRRFSA